MSPQNHQRLDDSGSVLLRLIDPRLPLPYVLGLIVLAVALYIRVQTLTEAVVSLQIEVKAGNQSWAGLSSEQALLKFRLSNTEEEVKNMRAAVTALQQRR